MAGLLDIFGTGGADTLGLLGMSPADIQKNRDEAQAQALYALAGRLFQGGNTGASIAQGLQMGQQAYKQAMRGELEDRMTQYQLQEYARKKQEEEASKKREALAQQLMMKAYQPAKTEVTTETPMFDLQGNQLMGPNMPKAARPAGYNKDVVNQMLAFKEGQAALGNVAKIMLELRKAGMYGEQSGENPFAIFVNDPTVPAPLRATAAQYQKSYSTGALDQETADKRFAELAQRIQSAQQFQQTQAGLEQQRQMMGAIAQGQLDLRQQAEANKPEQFSYSQRKDFDEIQIYKDDARKASANAGIAKRAAPLIEQAYTGSIEAGAKGILGAVGYETEAKTANDQLVRLSNQLAVNAPKFSGPTSDRDAARYDAAVGDLANPRKTVESKRQALKDIIELSRKAEQYSTQAENYFYNNNKSLRGFKFKENPYDGM